MNPLAEVASLVAKIVAVQIVEKTAEIAASGGCPFTMKRRITEAAEEITRSSYDSSPLAAAGVSYEDWQAEVANAGLALAFEIDPVGTLEAMLGASRG